MKYTLFSIDQQDPEGLTGFISEWKNFPALRGNLIPCHGKWEGIIEASFCSLSTDYDLMKESNAHFFQNQKAVLRISENNNQEAWIEYCGKFKTTSRLGVLRAVDRATAIKHDGWTYRPDLNQYWIIDLNDDFERRKAAYAAYRFVSGVEGYNERIAQQLATAFGFPESERKVNFTMHPIEGSNGFTIKEKTL